jgi:hypothetical protein
VVENLQLDFFAIVKYQPTLDLPIEGYEAETSVPEWTKGRQQTAKALVVEV